MRSPIFGWTTWTMARMSGRGRVVLAAVAPGVAHVLDLGFVEVRQLVLLGLRAEAQLVDVVDDLAQVVAALDLVLDLAEDLADLVFDGVRPAGLLLEAVQVGEELLVDEVAEVVAGQRLVVVELAVLALGRGPAFPAVGLVEDEGVLLPLQRGLDRPCPAPGRRGTSGTGARRSARCSRVRWCSRPLSRGRRRCS